MNNEGKYVIRSSHVDFVQDSTLANSTGGQAPTNAQPVAESDNFSELGRKTNDFLERVRAEARRIIEDARREAVELKKEVRVEIQREMDSLNRRSEELEVARKTLTEDLNSLEERRKLLENETFETARKKGYKKGFAEGRNDGYQQGIDKSNEELEVRVAQGVAEKTKESSETALAPLRKLTREMSGARQTLLKNWEENIMQIAAAIAYQTILREPAIMREAPLDLLREALELAMNCASLKIRMNPTDVAELQEQINLVLEETGNLAKSEIVSDPKITRGGCLVETALGVVDERLESRLERIVAELSE